MIKGARVCPVDQMDGFYGYHEAICQRAETMVIVSADLSDLLEAIN